jgi:hypothetical protein
LQVAVERSGLHDRDAVARANIDDAIHALETDHHAAGDRNAGAGGSWCRVHVR